ncbi:pyocin knob domain-containing protein [Pseudoalteromonas xiamenensis]
MDDVTIASPDVAGRSYFEFDGVKHFVKGLALKLEKDDVIKFVVKPSKKIDLTIIDGVAGGSKRAAVFIQSDQKIALINATNSKVDGELAIHFPDDGLAHTIEVTTTTSCILDTVGADINYNFKFKGQIYDLEVIRNGQRIHYFPLRTDAFDYLAGNLVKDEEFTYSGNWVLSGNTSGISVVNNAVNFVNTTNPAIVESLPVNSLELGATYRFLANVEITTGSISLDITDNTGQEIANVTASGLVDKVVVLDSVGTLNKLGVVARGTPTNATIKNFRVIKLNELSPSASFSSATGFALSGGVTIAGGQAVFGSDAGVKNAGFNVNDLSVGKTYRIAIKVNSATTGTLIARQMGSGGTQGAAIPNNVHTEYNLTITVVNSITIAAYTANGWDGNVEYFSVTEVTDGEVIGESEIVYENHWAKQLDSKDIGTKSDIDVGTSTQLVPSAKAVNDFLAQFGLGSKSANADLISSGDLNNYRGQFFGYVSGALSGNVANAPAPNNGYFVSLPSSASNYNMQLYFIALETQPMRVYFRRQANGTWQTWQRFYSTEDKPTASDVGAIPSATINGFVIVDMNTLYQKNETVFIASASTNTPKANKAYICSVKSVKSSGAYRVWQSATDYTTGEVFTRAFANNVWTSWSKVYSTNHKPTANEIHATLGGLASSPFTFKGRDLLIYGKRALVGYDPTRENKLIINYGADWPQVDVAGNWNFAHDVSIVGDLKFTGPDSYIWTPNRENGFFGVYDSYKNAVALKYTYDGGFEFKRKLVLGSSGQTVLDAGGGLSVKVTTPTGWVDIGSQNPDFCHFYTSNPAYFFDRKISVRGEIYAGANYDKKVYHEGNKPTASDVGAGTFNGAVYAAKGYSWRCTLQTTPNAIGVDVYKHDGSVRVGGCGVHSFSGGIDDAIAYLGTGKDPWNGIEGIRVNASKFTYKGFDVYHKGNLPPLLSSFGIGAENDLRGTIYELGLPRDIYGTGTRSGLANGGTDGLGIPWVSGSNKLGLLSVSAQWGDGTGVVSFVREFTSYTGGKFYQTGKDADTWNAWRKVIDTSNIQSSLQDTTTKPTSGNLSLGENHLTTNNTIKLPATTSLDVDSVVKVTKRFAVTPQIEVDNPTTDKIAFFKDRVVQFDTSITFDVGAILTFILNDNKEWELQ